MAHVVERRVLDRALRTRYDRLVVQPRGGARLRSAALHIGREADLPGPLKDAAARVRVEADQVIDHRIDLLGSGLVELGDPIDWHRDFKSGYRWPEAFYQDVQVTRLDDDSDAKVPWDLSRSHHLLTLARAFQLSADERYAEELERQLSSWLDANPPGRGINWVTPMEIAIRAVNWIWAVRTVEAVRPLESGLRQRVAASLEAHGRHVRLNLEGTPYLRSNHHLSDLVGLLAIGWALEGKAGDRWFAYARRELEGEMEFQVFPDGVDFEASLPYHGLVLELFLVAHLIARDAGQPLSPRYESRLRQMLEVSQAVRHPNGRTPQFGDGDSGRILPAGFARPPSQDHLLWLGAALVTRARPLAAPPDHEVAWTLGIDSWRAAERLRGAPAARSRAFTDGGIYVLRDGPAHLVVRNGGVGLRGYGSHGHNDNGSFELSYGVPLVVDAGTYAYTNDPSARNAFRATAAHNTVRVAGEEINPFDPEALFEIHQAAKPKLEGVELRRLTISHDGYERLATPTVHRRTVQLESGGRVAIRDELLGDGAQTAESFLHLAAGVEVGPHGEAGRFELRVGDRVVDLSFQGTGPVAVEEGWISDGYGRRECAPVLVAAVEGDMPLVFGYSFEPRS